MFTANILVIFCTSGTNVQMTNTSRSNVNTQRNRSVKNAESQNQRTKRRKILIANSTITLHMYFSFLKF